MNADELQIDHNGTDILSYRYLFADTLCQTDGMMLQLRPVLVVAKRGAHNDWAAYAAGVSLETPTVEQLLHVAAYGAKLTEDQASGFWPSRPFAGMEYRR